MTMITQIFIDLAFDTKYLDHCKNDAHADHGIALHRKLFIFSREKNVLPGFNFV